MAVNNEEEGFVEIPVRKVIITASQFQEMNGVAIQTVLIRDEAANPTTLEKCPE